jgi:hypothetical protein
MIEINFHFNPKKILLCLIFFEIILAGLYLIDSFLLPNITLEIFDLDGEANIPAWFSSVQLLLIGVVFFIKHLQTGKGDYSNPIFFLIICLGFIFLSVDEMASIHEKINNFLKGFEFLPRFKGNHGIWIICYLIIGIFLFISTYSSIKEMWRRHRYETTILATGMGLLIFGAVFLEIIHYQFLNRDSLFKSHLLEVTIEEFFEMLGASTMLFGALHLIKTKATSKA